ncbi:MAG: hypothetical protein HY644_04275 [Acidobacteria bacterium]|nr:hypothetical protein [Acidobacteriota bacterium]
MRANGQGFAVIMLLFCGVSASARQNYYLPQVANGQFSGGSFRTTFVLFNTNATNASINIRLTRDNGTPLRVSIPELGNSEEFQLILEPGSTRILQTAGSGALAAGAATISSNISVGVSAIFSVYDSAGNFLTESGVAASQPMSEFVIPVDATGAFNTGVALFNSGTSDATVTFKLIDATGLEKGTFTQSLAAKAHLARFVSGDIFAGISNFRGSMVISCTSPVAALTLRQNSSPLSYTSLPAVPKSSGQLVFNLPQVADGSFTDGRYRTTFLLFNVSNKAANVKLALTRDDGTPLPVTLAGQGTNSTFTLKLQPGASSFLQSDGNGSLSSGAAKVISDVPIGVSAIFSIFDSAGRFLTETGIGDSLAQTEFVLPIDVTGAFDTAASFFNPLTEPVSFSLRLIDSKGAEVGIVGPGKIGPGEHVAGFISQVFPGISNFRGSLYVSVSGSATASIAALTLRQNSAALSLTSLPVAPRYESDPFRLADAVTQAPNSSDRYDALLDIMRALNVGVYTGKGEALARGAERGPADFYLYDFELSAMAGALGRKETWSASEIAGQLSNFGVQSSNNSLNAEKLQEVLTSAASESTQDPGNPLSLVLLLIRELGLRHTPPSDITATASTQQIQFDALQRMLIISDVMLPSVPRRTIDFSVKSLIASLNEPGDRCSFIGSTETSRFKLGKLLSKGLRTAARVGGTALEAVHNAYLGLVIDIQETKSSRNHNTHLGPGGSGHSWTFGGPPGAPLHFEIGAQMLEDLSTRYQEVVDCGALAGLKFPPKGPIKGVQIRWDYPPVGSDYDLLIKHGRTSYMEETNAAGVASLDFYPDDEPENTKPWRSTGDMKLDKGVLTPSPAFLEVFGNITGMGLEYIIPRFLFMSFSIEYHNAGGYKVDGKFGDGRIYGTICSGLDKPFTLYFDSGGVGLTGTFTFTPSSSSLGTWTVKGGYLDLVTNSGAGTYTIEHPTADTTTIEIPAGAKYTQCTVNFGCVDLVGPKETILLQPGTCSP